MYIMFDESGTFGFYHPELHEITEEMIEIPDELYYDYLNSGGLKIITKDLELVDAPLDNTPMPEPESVKTIRLLKLQLATQTERQEMTDDLLQELILQAYT